MDRLAERTTLLNEKIARGIEQLDRGEVVPGEVVPGPVAGAEGGVAEEPKPSETLGWWH